MHHKVFDNIPKNNVIFHGKSYIYLLGYIELCNIDTFLYFGLLLNFD